MSSPILTTKLYTPLPRPNAVPRHRLIEKLNEGLFQNQKFGRKLTLVSAPAGFGKTTLVSEWVAGLRQHLPHHPDILSEGQECEPAKPLVRLAWLSLDEGDSEPIRFLMYLITALQTVSTNIGAGVLAVLQSPQPTPTKSLLTNLLNEIAAIPDRFILVLDDYHAIDSKLVDHDLTFLLEHLPPQMHLVIASREDPHLPLARLHARDQLTELRAADLRFTPSEAAEFLNQVMSLNLTAEDIAALETRTEGWIAGLQLAALSMQGHQNSASFIQVFTGSDHFVLDYLLEEVLQQQSESVQAFLLRTSILDRLCGALCDAVLHDTAGSGRTHWSISSAQTCLLSPWITSGAGTATIISLGISYASDWDKAVPAEIAEYHLRASLWYEKNGDDAEAFQHAFAAGDFGRAAGLASRPIRPWKAVSRLPPG